MSRERMFVAISGGGDAWQLTNWSQFKLALNAGQQGKHIRPSTARKLFAACAWGEAGVRRVVQVAGDLLISFGRLINGRSSNIVD